MNRREFIKAVGAGLLVSSPIGLGTALANKEEADPCKFIGSDVDALEALMQVQDTLLKLELYFEGRGCIRFSSICFELDTLGDLNIESFIAVLDENATRRTFKTILDDTREALEFYADTDSNYRLPEDSLSGSREGKISEA